MKPAPEIVLEKTGGAWKVAKPGRWAGLHKTHALQGPDRRRLSRSLPAGPPHRHAVERRREPARAAHPRTLRSRMRP